MNENIALFLKKVSEDTALQAQFKTVTSPDEAYVLASSIQPGFTKDEFIDTMHALRRSLDGEELSEADLALIAGGKSAAQMAFEDFGMTVLMFLSV